MSYGAPSALVDRDGREAASFGWEFELVINLKTAQAIGVGGYMRKAFLALALFCISLAHAQTDVLIEIDRGRTEGVFTKSPVFQRAILAKPAKPTDTALLYFRGYPGIARIQ